MDYPEIFHHGARDGVTGSCHQLRIDEHQSLLIDCGLFQGAEISGDGRSGADRLAVDFSLKGIRALVATHVHIDHVGRIPYLMAAGFKGPILCSEPSAKLLPIVLEDTFKLGISRDQHQVERFISQVSKRLVPLPYKTWFTLIDEPWLLCRVRLQRAGHILGSAYVECDLHNRRSAEKHRLVFSGDLGAPHAPLLPPPGSPRRADTLVMESTYGNRVRQDRRSRRTRLESAIRRALQDKGTVLIPAFSIGRTQELLYELEDIIHRCKTVQAALKRIEPQPDWPQLPVILDSPLASRFTRVYRSLQPYWDEEAHKRLQSGRKPLGFEQLLTIDSHHDHLKTVHHLADTARPAIVIAGSGMCSSGRIVNYLKTMLSDARHNVLFVGYQARGTAGNAIQTHGPNGGYVELDGERIDIRAGTETIGGYSAHADQQDLLNFVTRMQQWPSRIRLIHGEVQAKQVLAEKLRALYDERGLEVLIEV